MDKNLLFMLILILIPTFIPTMFIPYWTRRTESFGVSIPSETYHNLHLKRMRKSYCISTGILSLAVIAFTMLAGIGFELSESTISILLCGLLSAYLVVSFMIYLYYHRKMKGLKEQHPEWKSEAQLVVLDTGFRSKKLTVSLFWYIIPFAIAISSSLITLANYSSIPERIPMQYNFNGDVTNWADKSYRSVMLMPIMQIYLILVFMFTNIIISKAKQQVSAVNTEASVKQNITFRRRWSAAMMIGATAMTVMFAIIQLSFIYPIPHTFVMGLTLFITFGLLVGAIVLSVTTGQGGSRISAQGMDKGGNMIDRDDDHHWKLGVFYFNPKDPAIFLEKRFGVGWTNNWAHPLSWVFIAVILGTAIGLPLLLQ